MSGARSILIDGMREIARLHGGPGPPTWAERTSLEELKREGVADVFVEPEEAPPGFWQVLVLISQEAIAPKGALGTLIYGTWDKEFRFAWGLPPLGGYPREDYEAIVGEGVVPVSGGKVEAGFRLSAFEHLLDVAQPIPEEVTEQVNDRARWFRVGLRFEDRRFWPTTSEHLHEEIVRPALLLLHNPDLASVDELYRKGFNRALANDGPGAVTAAQSAIQEMLRKGLGVKGLNLKALAKKARDDHWLSEAAFHIVNRLESLRPESDAHDPGTADFEDALFALHLAGSVLLRLGRAGPFASA